jgi:hypothetical protein
MNFKVHNADFQFTIEFQQVNGEYFLESFTATKDNVHFACFIQLDGVDTGEEVVEFCCSPLGCTSGGCRGFQTQSESASA